MPYDFTYLWHLKNKIKIILRVARWEVRCGGGSPGKEAGEGEDSGLPWGPPRDADTPMSAR